MHRPSRPARRRGDRALRAVAAVVLVGYGLALNATPVGHGFLLAEHLVVDHHETLDALVFGEDTDRGDDHNAIHDPDDAHDHGDAHDHDAVNDHDAGHAPDGAQHLAPGFHSHHGRVHSHHEEPPPPPLLTVVLDKHLLLSGPVVPAPLPARGLDSRSPAAALISVVLSVEERPPQRAA